MSTATLPRHDHAAPADFEHLIVRDQAINAAIRRTYAETYYKPEDADFVKSDLGQWDLDFNTFTRYNQSVRNALPWVSRVFPLKGKRILEVGCGTGSSTAAFAQVAASVHSCDVNDRALPTAKERLRLLNIDNVTIDPVGAPEFMGLAREKYSKTFDMVLLFAVLEHQTMHERVETLRQSWELLSDGGVLVVIETPNRLCYFDTHTTCLPFYGMLPPDMVIKCAPMTKGEAFKLSMATVENAPREERELLLTRWGRGISFHDFDLAIPRDQYTVVADGYELEMINLFGVSYDERLLQSYFAQAQVNASPAFCRCVLNLILQKDGGAGHAPVRNFSPLVATLTELNILRAKLDELSHNQIRTHLDHIISYSTAQNYQQIL